MALSGDLRTRVVEAVIGSGLSRNAAAERFGVSVASAVRWVKRFETTGEISPARTGIRSYQAGVDGEPIGSDQPFGHAAPDDGFEQVAQDVTLAKAPVPVLGKGRMDRDLAIQTEPAKPAIGEIEMNLLAHAALRP